MEPLRILNRTWPGLLRRHQLLISTRRWTSDKSDVSRLHEWEQRVGKLADRLNPELGEKQQQHLAQTLRDLLDSQIERQSSNPTLHSHFNELFAGLDTISGTTAPLRLKDGLSGDKTESQILQWFDKVYYQGKATYKIALTVLKDPRVTHIDRLVHQVNNGGILIRWTGIDKHFFQLHVANKYWRLGERSLARDHVSANFDSVWIPELVADELPTSRVNILLRAVVATMPEQALKVAHKLAESKRYCALYLLWTNAVLFKQWQVANAVTYGAGANSLFQALALVTDSAQEHGAHGLDPLLKLVPRRKDFEHQVSSALMQVGDKVPDLRRPLAEKLVDVDADEVTGARIAAFRLSLA